MSNPNNNHASKLWRLFASVMTALSVFTPSGLTGYNRSISKPDEPLDLPDLTIQSLTISPSVFQPGQPVTITAIIGNIGNAYVGAGFYWYLYIDPSQQPPISSTTPSRQGNWPFGLAPGSTIGYSVTNYPFDSPGCGHRIYAWVDRNNMVTESNENNNLSWIDFCVGSQETPDIYEPMDNACVSGTILPVNATPQQHNFAPAGDNDWYKMNLIAGTRYAVSALEQGTSVAATLDFFGSCDQAGSLGSGVIEEFTAPATAQYYIRASNLNISAIGQTSYTIALTSISDCSGFYEPNDSQSFANDIATGDTPQIHTFCKSGDEDWVRLNAAGGYTYVVRSDRVGILAQPSLQLVSGLGNPIISGNPITAYSASDTIFYIRSANQNPSAIGQDTRYLLSVTTPQGCAPDSFENDNSPATAKTLTLNAIPLSHTICPTGDIDWARFDAIGGGQYSIEAAWAGQDAASEICVTDTVGTELECEKGNVAEKGARINWTSPANGVYFIRAKHANPEIAGSTTRYLLSISNGSCIQDAYETDDFITSAKQLAADGSYQTHNFCPQNDLDYTNLIIPQAGVYAIETSNLGPGSDTILSLFANDGTTRLSINDDYGTGLASRLIYTFTSTGSYYLLTKNFNRARLGSANTYNLSASPLVLFPGGTPTVVATFTPTPTATPTPSPTPTPTSTTVPQKSSIKTLIVTNKAQLESIYGSARTSALFNKLKMLESQPGILGQIVDVNQETSIRAAYDIWVNNVTNPQRANDIALIIRSYLSSYFRLMPSLQYIVIVGDDRIIPFRRIADRTQDPESRYLDSFPFLTSTALGAAFANKYFFSDDYYASSQSNRMGEQEVYLPDYGIGRLVETPEQMGGVIDSYLSNSSLPPGNSLIAGYNHSQDLAVRLCSDLGPEIGPELVDCSLARGNWNNETLAAKQFNASPLNRLQFINIASSHQAYGQGANPITAAGISTNPANLSGSVIFLSGDHAGLNVPSNSNFSGDLVESLASRNGQVIASTGYIYVGSDILWTERLIRGYEEEVTRGFAATIGNALMEAKRRYYLESNSKSAYDSKVIQQTVLYGLPMYEVQTHASFASDPFPSVGISITLGFEQNSIGQPSNTSDVGSIQVSIPASQNYVNGPSSPTSAYQPVSTSLGTYYSLNGHASGEAYNLIQPQYFRILPSLSNRKFKGLVLTSGSYITTTAQPSQAIPKIESLANSAQGQPYLIGFNPALGFNIRSADGISSTSSTLSLAMGQSNPQTGEQRLFTQMSYDVYMSANTNTSAPALISLDGYRDSRSGSANFKIEATDDTAVTRVVIVHTSGDGSIQSKDLSFDLLTKKWLGNTPLSNKTSYIVQLVDDAGNVAVIAPYDGYFSLPDVVSDVQRFDVFLPIIRR